MRVVSKNTKLSKKIYIKKGSIKSLKEFVDKNGNRMAFGSLQNSEGDTDFVIFSNTWDKCKNLLKLNKIVTLEGNMDNRNTDKSNFIVIDLVDEYGKQYEDGDDKYDSFGFKKKARKHQSKYRFKTLKLNCYEDFGNRLCKEDANKGYNFYPEFGIFEEAKRMQKLNETKYQALYQDMLRSEHIPFNLFVPFFENKSFLKEIFNEILNNVVESINCIKIEYKPKPKKNYLDDGTAFDVYIEYTHIKQEKGIIGIEIKYTEQSYSIGKEEKNKVQDPDSTYYDITKKSGAYFEESIEKLKTDDYRQIWRNHLLGESILIADAHKFKYFNSITFFPSGNIYFLKTSREYKKFLKHKDKCLFLTYEYLFELFSKYCIGKKYGKWIKYLNSRYIIE